ncbi:hypothetical protein SAMN05660662_1399 [Blastococcus aurantiacus]|uniref:Uncharacterized protein n=1 Tax=Blastococcus aurantiacus TaxID=1550231 RepID=A0A1G7JC28_9ACTN|nr:hypothetical protein [Blastococcus aurantiacus]SDF22029.1 hypothetical protein SAMN05660662_1399 [Blastococcus aurantiacus]
MTETSSRAEPGRVTLVPEPARPAARGIPQRDVVRRVRLVAGPQRLALVRDGRVLREFAVGAEGDVTTAAHLGGPLLADVAPHSLGAVDLLAPDGSRVARIDLRDWVPEAEELTRPREALERSGVPDLLDQAGIPLRPVPPSELVAALTASPPLLTPWRRLPVAYTVLRSAAAVLAVVALLWAILGDEPPVSLWTAAASGLLLSTLAAAGLWAFGLLAGRDRGTGAPALRPLPAVPSTRRFRRTAQLRLEPEDVVVVDGLGRERRLPRGGSRGVTSAAVVRPGTATAQLELRTADGTPRATLPWALWFGADGADAALERACADAGLLLDRSAAPARRPQDEEHLARGIHSPPGRATVAAATWPSGLPGQAAVWQTAAFAAFLLMYGFLVDDGPAVTVALLATLVLTAGVQWGRLLWRRLVLDRPGGPA